MIVEKSVGELIKIIELDETIDFSLPSLEGYCYSGSSVWYFTKFFDEYVAKIIRTANIEKPVGLIKCFKGINGTVIQIEDSGEGFDFKETQRGFENEEKYYQNGGKGWKRFNRLDVLVSFEGKGNIINLLYLNPKSSSN